MEKLKLKAPWQYGLHVRLASQLCNLLRDSKCDVMIGNGKQMVKASRIIDVIELGIKKDEYVIIEIKGYHEKEVAEKICQFFRTK